VQAGVHREIRDKSIYALVVAKNGPKLKAAKPGEVEAAQAQHPDAVGIPGGSGVFVRGPANGHIDIYGATTDTLALLLSGPAGPASRGQDWADRHLRYAPGHGISRASCG
jgi:uncharacterized protein (TIGR03435 family)